MPTKCVNEAQQWDEYDPVINDRELLFHKKASGREEISKEIKLNAGQPVEVKMEYVRATGDPSQHVAWSGPGLSRQILTPNKNASVP